MAQQPPDKPELPSNYDSYLIVNKNFTLKDTVDYDRLMKVLFVILKPCFNVNDDYFPLNYFLH